MTCRIAIVGGGLAGLAAAQALKAVDLAAEVFEAAPALGEIGAAVNASPQAVKALRAIGVGAAVAAVGNESPGIYTRNMQTGELLERSDRFEAAVRFGAPYYTFHRADLLDALATGLDARTIHYGHRLTGLEEHGDRTVLVFANGARVEAEIVIGADGVRSVVRQALYGDDNPTYTGQMVWRAMLAGDDVPEEVLAPIGRTQWVGPGCHLLAYYIRGTKLVNIVTQEDTDQWVEEGWSIRGDPDEMRASFPDPEPRLAALLGLVVECSKWGLFTRPLTNNWGRGRIQLIGDAAHAMLPNAGQGACQGFEDAYILARWLAARSGGRLRRLPARTHSARARRAAAVALQRPLQAHARSAPAETGDCHRHRQHAGHRGLGLGLRSRARMGQGSLRAHGLRGMSCP